MASIHQGYGFAEAALVGIAAGAVASVLLALPALRLSSEYIILLTLAALYIVQSLVSAVSFFGGGQGLYGIQPIHLFGEDLLTPQRFIPLVAVAALITLLMCARLSGSAYGRALRGLREDEGAAQSVGKRTARLKLSVFGVTGAFVGLAGVIIVYYAGFVAPQQFTTQNAIVLFTVIIVGGSGNILGSVLGAIIVVELTPLLENVLRLDPIYAGTVQQIAYGVLLVLFILVRPEGVLPERLGRLRKRPALAASAGKVALAEIAVGDSATAADAPAPAMSGARRTSSSLPPAGAVTSGPPSLPARNGRDSPLGALAPAPLVIRGLRKAFASVRAVDGVDLDVEDSKITCLIGPNGAGKTTIFGLLTGFLRPDSGSVQLNGRELVGLRPDRIANLGLVRSFQDIRIFLRMSTVDNVRIAIPGQRGERGFDLFARPHLTSQSEQRAAMEAYAALEFVGLADKANLPAGGLAYPEQKLLALARSLATGAQVLLLDEPTSGIDPDTLGRIAELIRTLPSIGKTVCVVEHNLGFLEMLGGDCYFLEAGKVVRRGALHELMSDRRLREAYFGV